MLNIPVSNQSQNTCLESCKSRLGKVLNHEEFLSNPILIDLVTTLIQSCIKAEDDAAFSGSSTAAMATSAENTRQINGLRYYLEGYIYGKTNEQVPNHAYEHVLKKIALERDPERLEYLRLKAKFEPNT